MTESSFSDYDPSEGEWSAAIEVCGTYHVAFESERELCAFTHDLLAAARRARRDDEPLLAGLLDLPDAPGTDAYDGSNASQTRDLTARERDVLCGLITDVYGQCRRDGDFRSLRGGRNWLEHLLNIREVIDPRREDDADNG